MNFERVDSRGQLAFVQDESGHIIQMITGQGYHSTFEKLPWYETPTFQTLLIALATLLMVTMLISTLIFWPLGALIRRLRKQSAQKPVSWGAVAACLWATLSCWHVGALPVPRLRRVIWRNVTAICVGRDARHDRISAKYVSTCHAGTGIADFHHPCLG